MVVGLATVLDLRSELMVKVVSGITMVLEVSIEVTAAEEVSGVGVDVTVLEGAADEEGLLRRGVSLLTTQVDASSVYRSK